VGREALFRYDPELDANQLELRVLYASPRFRTWFEEVLPSLGSTWRLELAPAEQFDAFMAVYASGETLVYQHQFYPLRHVSNSVWELKTADLRIFGWFHQKDHFVAVAADTSQRVKDHDLYHGYANDVVRFSQNLDLDEPKLLAGDDPNAVVSRFSYPD
jgi:hypothetical protein